MNYTKAKAKHEKRHVSDLNKLLNITKTVVCRLTLFSLGVYNTFIIGCIVYPSYYALFVFSAIILLDTVYICVFKGGADFKW